uniref:Uncharacterized protein n=1 Tax=Avena sativa TaxID=4498 RepID=A0ACD5YP40_AVESA
MSLPRHLGNLILPIYTSSGYIHQQLVSFQPWQAKKMRTSQILLIALALMVLSSHHMPATVSAAGKSCQTHVLNPAAPCNPPKCFKACADKIKGGIGACLGHPFQKGCYCEHCPAASSSLPRKLIQMMN